MRMEAGDYISRATAPCSVQLSATSACVYLEKDLTVVETMPALEPENGFLIMVVSQQYPPGERHGFR